MLYFILCVFCFLLRTEYQCNVYLKPWKVLYYYSLGIFRQHLISEKRSITLSTSMFCKTWHSIWRIVRADSFSWPIVERWTFLIRFKVENDRSPEQFVTAVERNIRSTTSMFGNVASSFFDLMILIKSIAFGFLVFSSISESSQWLHLFSSPYQLLLLFLLLLILFGLGLIPHSFLIFDAVISIYSTQKTHTNKPSRLH